jgi:hypothetical protein
MIESLYRHSQVETFCPQTGAVLELVWNGGEQMNHLPPQDAYPDEDTLQAWENMRIEILHELQDGGSTDVPDSDIDVLGTLVPVLESTRAHKRLRVRVVKRPNAKLMRNNN